jgi:chlorobactene glucosyltransferase
MLGWFLANVLINLAIFPRPKSRAPRDGEPGSSGPAPGPEEPAARAEPSVSVMIPARNEARRIGDCLRTLTDQTYRNLEILVLDDKSTDDTSAVVRGFGFQDQELHEPAEQSAAAARDDFTPARRLFRGTPLPEGWTGKAWACRQLAQQARGEFFVFTDADTAHDRDCIRQAVLLAQRERADLLSLWPRQQMLTWSEKLIIPFIYLLILGFLPQWMVRVFMACPWSAKRLSPARLRSFGSANGQFVMFRAPSYHRLGGHRTVRDHLVEDVALGREVAMRIQDGARLINADGYHLVSCRMYEGFGDLWEGFSKNLRPAFEKNPGAFVGFGLMQLTGFILPFWAVARKLRAGVKPWRLGQVGVQCLLVLLIRGVLTWRFGTSLLGMLAQPVGHGLALIIAANSWRLSLKQEISWKGRRYGQ